MHAYEARDPHKPKPQPPLTVFSLNPIVLARFFDFSFLLFTFLFICRFLVQKINKFSSQNSGKKRKKKSKPKILARYVQKWVRNEE